MQVVWGTVMFEEASELCQDISILRRLCFPAKYLNKETPKYWDFVRAFGFMSVDRKTDSRQMHQLKGFQGHPLGIVLLSANNVCQLCGGSLLVPANRPSFPVIYQELQGTTCGTHFRKHCQNNHKGCSFIQHYGFCTKGTEQEVVYDQDCLDLPFSYPPI